MKWRLGQTNTQRIVRKAVNGDEDAFRILVERYEHPLRALIHLRLGPGLRQRVEVDDILQETFLRAYQALDQFQWRDNKSLYRWLGGIAEHVIQKLARFHLQTQKRMVARERSLEHHLDEERTSKTARPAAIPEAQGPSPSTILRRSERFERLEEALNRLRPDHREVIMLARVRELPLADIARQMGRSRDAISMLLLRALRELRKHLDRTESVHLPPRSLADSRTCSP